LFALLLLALVEPWSLVELPPLALDPFGFDGFLDPEFFAVVEPSLELFPPEAELSEELELAEDPELADAPEFAELAEPPESEGFELLDEAFEPELPDDALLPPLSELAVEEFPLSLGGGLDVLLLEFG